MKIEILGTGCYRYQARVERIWLRRNWRETFQGVNLKCTLARFTPFSAETV